jgi:glycerate kinase
VAQLAADFLETRLPSTITLDICPIADGGDDTLNVLQYNDPAWRFYSANVTGPVPNVQVEARYLLHTEKKVAVIEAAQAHGYALLPDSKLVPMTATSYGVGELLNAVLHQASQFKKKLETIAVTLGGSASTDGGLGALQALGVRFLDQIGEIITQPIGGEHLARIQKIEWTPHWPYDGQLLIATDVVNPLLGPDGTAHIFAPQKGATSEQCEQLEASLTHISHLMTAACDVDTNTLPGTGAAGGLAYGLRHLPRSGIISGSHWIAESLNLQQRIADADVILTGEGRLDATSFGGKATGNILAWADSKPTIVICGQLQDDLDFPPNVSVFPLATSPQAITDAMHNPKQAFLMQLENALPIIQTALK